MINIKKLEKEKHILRCYLCHPVTHVPVAPPIGGYGLGDVLSICSEASQSVIDDNMFLKGVDNFMWRRTVTLRNGEKKVHVFVRLSNNKLHPKLSCKQAKTHTKNPIFRDNIE